MEFLHFLRRIGKTDWPELGNIPGRFDRAKNPHTWTGGFRVGFDCYRANRKLMEFLAEIGKDGKEGSTLDGNGLFLLAKSWMDQASYNFGKFAVCMNKIAGGWMVDPRDSDFSYYLDGILIKKATQLSRAVKTLRSGDFEYWIVYNIATTAEEVLYLEDRAIALTEAGRSIPPTSSSGIAFVVDQRTESMFFRHKISDGSYYELWEGTPNASGKLYL